MFGGLLVERFGAVEVTGLPPHLCHAVQGVGAAVFGGLPVEGFAAVEVTGPTSPSCGLT
ncbi:hypothetical protein [Streptomyces virginiae]